LPRPLSLALGSHPSIAASLRAPCSMRGKGSARGLSSAESRRRENAQFWVCVLESCATTLCGLTSLAAARLALLAHPPWRERRD